MSQKEDLVKIINEKKAQLATASKGSESWKRGKSRSSGVAQVSKISVLTLQKEIKNLSDQIKNLDK